MAIQHVFSNAVADAVGTMTVWNGATTATVAVSDIVKPSDWNSAHNNNVTLTGNTAGVSTVSGTNIVFAGGPNVTLSAAQGANVATISFSGGAGAAGNTGYVSAGTTNASLGTLSFANSNGVSWGVNGQTITATVATNYQSQGAYLTTAMASNRGSDFVAATAAFAGTNASGTIASNGISVSVNAQSVQPVAASAANGSYAFSTLSFSNANGISFGTSAGSAITASHNALTSQSNQAFSAGAASSAFQTLIFQDSNGVSFSNNAGSIRVTHDLQFTSATSAITANALHSSASRVINIVAATNNTGGGTASLSSNVSFSAANGITFYTSAGGAVVASHNALTSQSNQNVTAANGGFAFQTLSFSNVNGISFGTSAGSAITGSYTRNVASNAIQSVGSATGSGTNTSRFAADDHVHAGVFSVGVSNVGNTAGDTRVDVGRYVFAGGANITISQATAANGLNTISIVGGAGGGGSQSFGMSTQTAGGATAGTTGYAEGSAIRYLIVPGSNITMSQSVNGASGTVSIYAPTPGAAVEANWHHFLGANTAGNTSISGTTLGFSGDNITLSGSNGSNLVIKGWPHQSFYENVSGLHSTVGAQANSMVSIVPFNVGDPISFSNALMFMSGNVASAANASSAYRDLSLSAVVYSRNNLTLSSMFSFSNSMTATWSSNATGTVTGVIGLTATMAGTSMSPGDYWMAVHVSTTNSATGGAATTALANTISMLLAVPNANSLFGLIKLWGGQTNASRGLPFGLGMISTNATRGTLAFSDMVATGTRLREAAVYFQLRNSTFMI